MTLGTAAIIGLAISAVGTGVSAIQSGRQARKARKYARSTQGKIEAREADRQEIINPYDRMSNLGSMISNPMAQLNVATEAAEFQAEQTDISLANTLDQMRAFGMGGGGATALAQGALQSKRGISANIQQQEARNAMARAQGEQSAMTMRMNEARRMQSMEAKGRAYEWESQENRDMAELDRLAKTQTNYQQQEVAAWGAQSQMISSGIGAFGGILSSGMSAQAQQEKTTAGNCFVAGTRVLMFDGTLKAIEEIKIGDIVKSLNRIFEIVKNTLIHDINDVMRVYKKGVLRTTDAHPIYINNKWTTPKQLNWDSELTFVDKLYNLDTDNTFIAENVIVSGKIEKVNKELEFKRI
tara:strand:- start:964 stop:2025 length:1062 start_codon:yes stop_codon:yes gene_type:complete